MGKPWIFFESERGYNRILLQQGNIDDIFRLSEKETEKEDKLMPSVYYLQKLGPEHLQQIFDSSRWIFDQDRDMAFQVNSHISKSFLI